MNTGFPSKPGNDQAIWDYRGAGERLACALVGKFDTRQRLAFRKLRLALGEQGFRECLCDARDTLGRSRTIREPAGWLFAYLRDEAAAAS